MINQNVYVSEGDKFWFAKKKERLTIMEFIHFLVRENEKIIKKRLMPLFLIFYLKNFYFVKTKIK